LKLLNGDPITNVIRSEVTIKTCPECGVEHNRKSDLCSNNCYQRRYHRLVYNPTEVAKTYDPKKCEVCGKEFIPKNFDVKYCRRSCSQRAFRLRKKEKEGKTTNDIIENVVENTKTVLLADETVMESKPSNFDKAMEKLRKLQAIKPIMRPDFKRDLG